MRKRSVLASALLALGLLSGSAAAAHAEPLVTLAGESTPALNQVLGAVSWVAQDYPEVRGTVVTAGLLKPSVYAQTVGKTITISLPYAADAAWFTESLKYDIDTGWHPVPGRCTPIQETAVHEAAHVIDLAHGRRPEALAQKQFAQATGLHSWLSEYSFNDDGTLNPKEALAEAFSAVRCNGGNAVEHQLFTILVGS